MNEQNNETTVDSVDETALELERKARERERLQKELSYFVYMQMLYTRQVHFGNSRVERVKELMGRHKARKWKEEKQAKMQRRLAAAMYAVESGTETLDEINRKIADVQTKLAA